MRRVIAILLLLLYAQAVLGISYDSCACGGQKVKVVLLRFTTACSICGGDAPAMKCCQSETSFGKADQHKLPVAAPLLAPSQPAEKAALWPLSISEDKFRGVPGQLFHRYGLKRSGSCRLILSLVQSFRI